MEHSRLKKLNNGQYLRLLASKNTIFCHLDVLSENLKLKKKYFYTALGCSIQKCTLIPLTISKIYWAVAIKKLLYGCEVRFIHPKELEFYETHHRMMARAILRLPSNSPDSFCLSALGWDSIEVYVEKMKFMFAWRVLNGDACSYRDIFIYRFFRIFNTGIYSCESPTAQFMNICNKYGILQDVYDMILNNNMPDKAEWKKNIFNYVVKRQVMHWRRSLRMYKNLSIYMNVENEYKANVWLSIARYNPKLSKPCNTIIRLLSGCNNLCSYKYHTPERKICINCNLNVKEDIFHFALICDKHNA